MPRPVEKSEMKEHRKLILLSVAALAACSQVRDDGPTLRDLERRSVEVEKNTTIPDSRSKAIESYQSTLKSTRDADIQREAKRKIANLEVEGADAANFEAVQKNLPPAGSGDKRSDELPAPENNRAAIDLYQDLLQNRPKQAGNKAEDESNLYQLARAYEQRGDYRKTLETLTRLVNTYPKIAYLDEVQFRRGEILFTLRDYEEAAKAYAAVLPAKKSQFYEMALYKHGWSLYKQDKYPQALDPFFAILDRKLNEKNIVADDYTLPRGQQEFVKDTLRVISLSFYHLQGPESITAWFSGKGHRPYEFLAYRQLGELYLEKERLNDAIGSFRAFVKEYPAHPQSMLMRQRIIDTYTKTALPALSLKEKEEYVAAFENHERRRTGGVTKTYAEHIIYSDSNTQSKITSFLKSNLEDVARHYHAVAQQDRQHASYVQAAQWYKRFLRLFPGDPQAVKVTFMLAELLYEDGRYVEAIPHYEHVAYEAPKNGDGAEAGYAALLAYQAQEKKLSGYDKNIWRRNAIVSSLRFAEKYPQDKRVPAILASVAEDLFSLKQYDKAEHAARLLLKKEPIDPGFRRTALTIIAHADFEREAYDRAEEDYRALLTLLPAGDPARNELAENLATAIYKQGEQSRRSGDMAMAINHFMRVSQVAPDSVIRGNAEYGAAVGYMALGQWDDALRLLNYFQRSYPGHVLQGDISRQLVLAYIQSGQPAKAAGELEKILVGDQDEPTRRGAAWQAIELYEKARDDKAAIQLYVRYTQLFPTPLEQAVEVRNRLVAAYQRVNDVANRDVWLRDIIKIDKEGDSQRTDHTRLAAAKAALVLAEPANESFRKVRLVEPLQQSLKTKKEKMEAALQAYALAAAYNIADVTTAATYQMGKIYSDFSRDLLDSQRPVGLSPEELEQYNVLLEEQAFPFEEKAIQIHESNVQRIAAGIYDEPVKQSLAELAKLLPAKYAKHEKSAAMTDASVDSQIGADEKALTAALNQNPLDAEAYNHLGIFYRNAGRFEDARKMYERGLGIDPQYRLIHLNMGILHDLYLRNPALALEHYRRYQLLSGGEDKQIKIWISDLERRQNAGQKPQG